MAKTKNRKRNRTNREWQPTPRQVKFVELMCGITNDKPMTITAAAAATPISRSQVYKWFEDPNFNAYLKRRREEKARAWAAAIDHALIQRAISGDVQAIRLFKEWVEGHKVGGDVHVNVNTNTIDPETARKIILDRLNLETTEE